MNIFWLYVWLTHPDTWADRIARDQLPQHANGKMLLEAIQCLCTAWWWTPKDPNWHKAATCPQWEAVCPDITIYRPLSNVNHPTVAWVFPPPPPLSLSHPTFSSVILLLFSSLLQRWPFCRFASPTQITWLFYSWRLP